MPRIFGLGLPELLIVLVILIVLFGPGRLGKTLGELGAGLKAFRDGLIEKKEGEQNADKNGNNEPK